MTFFFPTKVNQVSAVVGKDFTVTPSNLIQFDPGTFCVYMFYKQSQDGGKAGCYAISAEQRIIREPYHPIPNRRVWPELLPLYVFLLQVNIYLNRKKIIANNKHKKIKGSIQNNSEK